MAICYLNDALYSGMMLCKKKKKVLPFVPVPLIVTLVLLYIHCRKLRSKIEKACYEFIYLSEEMW